MKPTLFTENLPGDADVDEDGNLWGFNTWENKWEYIYIRTRTKSQMWNYSKWLPFYCKPNFEELK
jgi:hypothetical protein